MANQDQPQYKTVDKFDRMLGSLRERPDVVETKASTKVVSTPVIGAAQTFIVFTIREPECRQNGKGEEVTRGRDTIFVQYVDDTGAVRIFLPPDVADLIANQRDALATKNRRRAAKAEAQRRKAAGIEPGFLKFKGKRKKA